MTYGTRILRNGNVKGYLRFDTGKVVRLNPKEVRELEQKIRYWIENPAQELTQDEA